MICNFGDDLRFSKDCQTDDVLEVIKAHFPTCLGVDVASTSDDKRGIDYYASFDDGVRIKIDAKIRRAGCSRYWPDSIPDIALELWSVVPERGNTGKVGWTLDTAKQTDHALFLYDGADTSLTFMIPFHYLQAAFACYGPQWVKHYPKPKQNSGRWRSQCVFVPANVVGLAVSTVMGFRKLHNPGVGD